jgi:hypothetical protein
LSMAAWIARKKVIIGVTGRYSHPNSLPWGIISCPIDINRSQTTTCLSTKPTNTFLNH